MNHDQPLDRCPKAKLLTSADLGSNVNSEIELPSINPRKSIVLIALGMGVYFIYLYHMGFQKVLESLENVDPVVFSLGFVLALLGVLGDSLAWRKVAEKFDYSVSIADIFYMYLSCIFLNNLIPSGSFSGESARIYFMEKIVPNSRFDKSSATVAATRIITAVPFFVGTLVGLAYLVLKTDAPAWALAACSGITVVLLFVNAIFFGVCFADNWLDRIICTIIDYVEKLFHISVDKNLCRGIVTQFHQSMQMLTTHKKTLFISTFWAVAAWLSMTLVASVTFRSMGIKVPLEAVFAVYAVMIFLQMLPLLLPGGVGLVDIVMITLFNAIGVPMHEAIAATILIRVVQLWFLTAAGGLATVHLIRKINKDPSKRSPTENVAKGF